MILGIDIAKNKFDVALFQGKRRVARGQFTNNAAGFKKLNRWLKSQTPDPVWACMEATGRYGDALAAYLHQQECSVSMVNPARIKKYAESQLQRNKTDKLDAEIIADFCRTQEPRLWTPPAPEKQQLKEMARRLNTLIKEQTREKNRLSAGPQSAVVRDSLAASLTFLATQITTLEAQLQAHIQQHAALKRNQALLVSIKGIGAKTAAIILGELPEIAKFTNSGQVVAYAGLNPRQHTSGSSVHKRSRLTKIGNSRLKTALYLPALSAIQHNPIVQALALRLEKRGKTGMTIVGAAMRKLLQLAYGVLKSGQPFDPHYVTKMPAAA